MFKKQSKTQEPENADKAYEYAVFLLSLHLRTIGELCEKMQQRGYDSGIIEKTVERLHEQRYVDDERYAEIFLDNLKQYRTLGYYGIQKKFMQKKLSKELIDRILQEGLPIEDEMKIARRFLKKEGFEAAEKPPDEEMTYRTYADSEANAKKQKIAQKLKSRGFRGEVIARLLF